MPQTQSRSYFSAVRTLLIISILLPLLGCQPEVKFDEVYKVVTQATLHAGDEIPLPTDEPILTVTGKIGTSNHDGVIEMDRATIERAGVVEYSVTDPFVEYSIRYTGVLMRDLLALWQVPTEATTVSLTALNDYMIDIPISDFQNYPILFALQADGVYMERDYQGPAMIVYPVDDYQFDLTQVKRNWIWQIKLIEIK